MKREEKREKMSSLFSLGLRIIFRPDPFKLIQVVRPKNGPVTGQVIKVIHDDSYEKVDDLKQEKTLFLLLFVVECLSVKIVKCPRRTRNAQSM